MRLTVTRSRGTPSSSTPQGAYAYSLRVRFNNNRIKIFTGSVLVIK